MKQHDNMNPREGGDTAKSRKEDLPQGNSGLYISIGAAGSFMAASSFLAKWWEPYFYHEMFLASLTVLILLLFVKSRLHSIKGKSRYYFGVLICYAIAGTAINVLEGVRMIFLYWDNVEFGLDMVDRFIESSYYDYSVTFLYVSYLFSLLLWVSLLCDSTGKRHVKEYRNRIILKIRDFIAR